MAETPRAALFGRIRSGEQRCGAPRYSTLVDRVLQERAKIRPQVPSDPTPLEVWIGEKAFERYLTDAKQKAPQLNWSEAEHQIASRDAQATERERREATIRDRMRELLSDATPLNLFIAEKGWERYAGTTRKMPTLEELQP